MNDLPRDPEGSHDDRGDLVSRFLDNQQKELEVRGQELVLRQQKDTNQFEFAKSALDAQMVDRRESREHDKAKRQSLLAFSLVVILLLLVFVGCLVYMDKEQIALELVKAAVFVVTGFLGGRGYQSWSGQSEHEIPLEKK